MPKVEEILREDIDLIAQIPPRSPGLHLSTILEYLDEMMDGPQYDKTIDANTRARFAIGLAWEAYLSLGLSKAKGWSVGEIRHDHIIYTPDFYDGKTGEVIEVKATSRAATRKGGEVMKPSSNRRWMWQVMAYMQAVAMTRHGSDHVSKTNDVGEDGLPIPNLQARFIVLHYHEFDRQPRPREWRLEFTHREIADNWRMIQNAAKAFCNVCGAREDVTHVIDGGRGVRACKKCVKAYEHCDSCDQYYAGSRSGFRHKHDDGEQCWYARTDGGNLNDK